MSMKARIEVPLWTTTSPVMETEADPESLPGIIREMLGGVVFRPGQVQCDVEVRWEDGDQESQLWDLVMGYCVAGSYCPAGVARSADDDLWPGGNNDL